MRRIGLVDDDEMVRYATAALLSLHKFHVEQFDSAESLLNAESMDNFDCLIIDYRMAGMTGLELLREVRRTTPHIPAIVLSGFTTAADVHELTEAGACAIMDKPVKTDDLLAELARATREQRAA